LANPSQGGCDFWPEKSSISAPVKREEEIKRYAASLASALELMRPKFCSAAM
jgi:hypothetical protein